jgi:hypothetical protein
MCQHSTTGVLVSEAMGVILPEHLGCNEHNALGRNMKPLPVFGVIKPDTRAFRNTAATIYQGIANVAIAANLDIRIDDRIKYFTERMYSNLRK